MAEAELPANGTPLFRELRGDYVKDVGQVVEPRQFLDYFEPLGSALSRLPEGAGGPFVHQFRGSGQKVVGAMGWVVSAASKRYGGWKLWGVWTDGPIPALTLPLCWSDLSDPQRQPELLRRANADADALTRRDAWPELLDRIDATRLHDYDFLTTLKFELSRLYRAPYPHQRPIEIEVGAAALDLLPWLHLLGPVDPATAQLQPSRFNGAGYQYILTETAPAEIDVPAEIESLVDTTANDVLQGFRMAAALRERRARPKRTVPSRPQTKPRPPESIDMPSIPLAPRRHKSTPAPEPPVRPDVVPTILRAARDVIVIALLAWIGFNVHQIRKSMAPQTTPITAATETASTDTEAPIEPGTQAPTPTRQQRIAQALAAQPPQGIHIDAAVLDSIAHDAAGSTIALARVAIEIFLRRNNCYQRTDTVDGKLSTAEQRAIRTCTALTTRRLVGRDGEPSTERAIDWLDQSLTTSPSR
jgi:hypothetical protein